MYSAVIFDLDGTLLDTLADLAGAMNRALARCGFPGHSATAYKRFIGDGAEMLVRRALPSGREDALSSVLADFSADYQQNSTLQTAPYPGIPALLASLRERGVRSAVLSNKPDRYIDGLLRRFFPEHEFAAAVGQRPDVPRKPDPAGALAIAAELSVSPRDILYVGDSGTDMRTAAAAGMDACGVLWGFRSAAELRETGARYLAAVPEDIFRISATAQP